MTQKCAKYVISPMGTAIVLIKPYWQQWIKRFKATSLSFTQVPVWLLWVLMNRYDMHSRETKIKFMQQIAELHIQRIHLHHIETQQKS